MPELVARGLFREDLFYRLNVFPVAVPPLRDRREDIPDLIKALLRPVAARLGRRSPPSVEPEVQEALYASNWPGNVRELRNVLERAAILAGDGPVALCHLGLDIIERCEGSATTADGFVDKVEAYKRKLLLESLASANWVKKAAAEQLGLSPRALSHYIGKYGLDEAREG
jgi:DNA-binding NtrC family response regulator